MNFNPYAFMSAFNTDQDQGQEITGTKIGNRFQDILAQREARRKQYLDLLSQSQEGKYNQQYGDTVNQMPNREDYTPSKWRRFGAILSSLGQSDPYAAAQRVVNQPYTNAMEGWTNKTGELSKLAQLEGQSDTNRYRQLVSLLGSGERADNGYMTALNGQTSAEAARIRANTGQGNLALREQLVPGQISNQKTLDQQRAADAEYKRRMAGVATQNAGTNAGRLGLERNKFTAEQDFNSTPNRIKMAGINGAITSRDTPQNNYVPADEQSKLEQLAASDVLRVHPEWSDYFDEYGGIKSDTDPITAAELKRWIQKAYQTRLTTQRR